MEDKKKPQATRAAVIGLIGTILTVCGGLTGAIVSASMTVYQVERERQQVALAAPGDERALTIDTRQIAINQKEAQQLDHGQRRIRCGRTLPAFWQRTAHWFDTLTPCPEVSRGCQS